MPLTSITSTAVITKMKDLFAQHGVAETVVSDNGRQFSSSEFAAFANTWNFNHVTSSPHFPQCNGAAERAVKTAKEILRQNDPALALLSYRSSPITDLGASPAEMAYNCRLRTPLPALPATLAPRIVNHDRVQESATCCLSLGRRHIMIITMVPMSCLTSHQELPSSSNWRARKDGSSLQW